MPRGGVVSLATHHHPPGATKSAAMAPSPQDHIRKRVGQACDWCRLKKSKCDSGNPCGRCKQHNFVCRFGERKKPQDRIYPKGYVELLEEQLDIVTTAARELYLRSIRGESWPGGPLPPTKDGHPLTHDILERLDLLSSISHDGEPYEGYEDNLERLQQRARRKTSMGSSEHMVASISSPSSSSPSSSSPNGTPTTQTLPYSDAFPHNAPPTPPMNSPFTHQSHIDFTTNEVTPQLVSTAPSQRGMDTFASGRIDVDSWQDFSPIMLNSYNITPYTAYGTLDQGPMRRNDPPMPMWDPVNDLVSY